MDGVSRVYPGPPPVTALRSAHITVGEGEYLAVMGPSGSGKSTLLNLLGLLDTPTEGTYELDGIDVGILGERRRAAWRGCRVGFVFQAFHLLAHRTAAENVMVAQIYNGASVRDRRRAAEDALRSVGLADRIDALPTTLSGGEKQRVAIARAIVNKPRILLCDEPTGNLDSSTAHQILSLLDQQHRGGQTIVMITHDLEVASRADRLLHIADGVIDDRQPSVRGPGAR